MKLLYIFVKNRNMDKITTTARVSKELIDKINEMTAVTGQKVQFYIDAILRPKVEKDYAKFSQKKNSQNEKR